MHPSWHPANTQPCERLKASRRPWERSLLRKQAWLLFAISQGISGNYLLVINKCLKQGK